MTRDRPRVLLVEYGGPGALALARVLRDAGMEVVYAGRLDTLAEIIRTAEQEDPDALGVTGTPPEGLRDALTGIRIFVLGERTDAAANTFGTPEEAEKWLSGGRSHTAEGPSDRTR